MLKYTAGTESGLIKVYDYTYLCVCVCVCVGVFVGVCVGCVCGCVCECVCTWEQDEKPEGVYSQWVFELLLIKTARDFPYPIGLHFSEKTEAFTIHNNV